MIMYKVKRFSVIDQKKMDVMTEQREFGNPANKAAKRLWEGKLALINNYGHSPESVKGFQSLNGLKANELVNEGRRINKYSGIKAGIDPLEAKEIWSRVGVKVRPRDYHDHIELLLKNNKSGLSKIG